MKITLHLCIILFYGIFFITESLAIEESTVGQKIMVQIELPSFDKKHQNPYFALWLSKENNEHKALVVVREKVKWLRDLKKFWRSIARENRSESDAVTGATNRNKKFNYEFSLNDSWDKISLEVAREHGTKEIIALPISFAKTCVSGKDEIAALCIELDTSN